MKSFFIFLIVIIASLDAASASDHLVLAGMEDSGNNVIGVKLLEKAYARLGISIELQEFPSFRALIKSNTGAVDGELHRIANLEKQYTNLIRVPVSIISSEIVVFSKNHLFVVNGWKSLQSYKIAIIRGTGLVEKQTKAMKPFIGRDYAQILNMLDAGRFQLAVLPYLSGLKNLKKLKMNNIQPLMPRLAAIPLYHYLHKKHAPLVPKITRVLKTLRKEGKMVSARRNAVNAYITTSQ